MTPTLPANPQRRNLLTASAAALVGAPALFNIARAQDGPIKIGFPTRLIGAFSAEAQDQVRAAELAVKEFNAAGGYKGRLAECVVTPRFWGWAATARASCRCWCIRCSRCSSA